MGLYDGALLGGTAWAEASRPEVSQAALWCRCLGIRFVWASGLRGPYADPGSRTTAPDLDRGGGVTGKCESHVAPQWPW